MFLGKISVLILFNFLAIKGRKKKACRWWEWKSKLHLESNAYFHIKKKNPKNQSLWQLVYFISEKLKMLNDLVVSRLKMMQSQENGLV